MVRSPDTIFALSSGRPPAAIAVVRISGPRARVALGTLFNYAKDKRDLVFLIFNEELNATTDIALAAPRPAQPFAEQLLDRLGLRLTDTANVTG